MGLRARSPARRAAAGAVVTALLAAALVSAPASVAAPSPAELEAARARLMELERDFELVVERYNLVSERLDTIRARMAQAHADVDAIARRMVAQRSSAVALARQLYMGGGATDALDTILSSQSVADVETRLQYLERSERAHTEVFERLAAERSALDDRIADLDAARAEAQEAERRLAELAEEIEDKVASQRDEIAALNAALEAAEERARARAERAARRAAAEEARRAARGDPAPSEARTPSPAPGPTPGSTPDAPPDPPSTPPAGNPAAGTAVDAALSQVGKPYRWGAAGPDAYDCSGLTMWAWARAGVSLPHNSGMQYAATTRVARSDWEPGDLLFFGSPIHHVAMYVGGGRMVEAPYTGSHVRVVSAYRSDYVGAGRP
ncbi:MAG TPA: NlpC/P60 family protein [Actinomycetota bacterium]|nr:NlpC/P60 family protein [Actinomycetota bacterium]